MAATARSVRRRRRKLAKKKVCRLCENRISHIDFKDVELLRRYQTEKGKILPRRVTGNCFRHQKALTAAIKRARNIALAP
jgi:small subunit ribosomal protein S18